MSELRVVATAVAIPESHDVVREALRTLVAATLQEPGCVAYDLFESAASAGTFVTVETWASGEDFDAHMHTPHIETALAALEGHLIAPPAIHPLLPVA